MHANYAQKLIKAQNRGPVIGRREAGTASLKRLDKTTKRATYYVGTYIDLEKKSVYGESQGAGKLNNRKKPANRRWQPP